MMGDDEWIDQLRGGNASSLRMSAMTSLGKYLSHDFTKIFSILRASRYFSQLPISRNLSRCSTNSLMSWSISLISCAKNFTRNLVILLTKGLQKAFNIIPSSSSPSSAICRMWASFPLTCPRSRGNPMIITQKCLTWQKNVLGRSSRHCLISWRDCGYSPGFIQQKERMQWERGYPGLISKAFVTYLRQASNSWLASDRIARLLQQRNSLLAFSMAFLQRSTAMVYSPISQYMSPECEQQLQVRSSSRMTLSPILKISAAWLQHAQWAYLLLMSMNLLIDASEMFFCISPRLFSQSVSILTTSFSSFWWKKCEHPFIYSACSLSFSAIGMFLSLFWQRETKKQLRGSEGSSRMLSVYNFLASSQFLALRQSRAVREFFLTLLSASRWLLSGILLNDSQHPKTL